MDLSHFTLLLLSSTPDPHRRHFQNVIDTKPVNFHPTAENRVGFQE